ncbi:hypothetical protein [Actinomadura rudentiformis]|uniref:SWIM-type domain-containing protein n=1 Tax=Actinomadura rudentiformis TaxID=359158 RepID=A0A6H9YJF3_9ACTN|nr:hypothetical protein [Actinomadura rudentiformis]KAB2344407.1 hypothetical protein F8566_31230 [Actinomadura rudentiformis]
MTRSDLLALTPDSLAALANRGLVKRATKDVESGGGPDLVVEADGTVRGRLPDGTETVLPAGAGLEAASCTCAATGTCRHRIAVVLTYQRDHAAQPEAASQDTASQDAASPEPGDELVHWSPGTIDDDALARVLGPRVLTAARRTHRAGYTARIHRPNAADPVPRVELPTCIVRFLVPGELGYAHTDAAPSMRDEAIVLAVWAFRVADERGLTANDVRVDVGGKSGGHQADLAETLDLAGELLLDGAMHTSPVLVSALRRAGQDLAAQNLYWPAAAAGDLMEQLTAYSERHAVYQAERLAELITELYARHRASRAGAASPRSQILGTDESADTPLRRVRLTALGCRIGGTDDERTADVYLAQAGSGIVLVLKRRWKATVTGHVLGGRRISGSPLRTLATANVVSEAASRSAGRVVRLGTGRVAKTTITPLGASWEDLPGSILVRDLRQAGEALSLLPPRLIRPRVEAELVRVVEIAEVCDIGYHPGDQRIEATIADAAGTTATVSATFNPYAPGALDDLAAALGREPRYVSGTLRRSRGALVLDPIAVLTADGATVPDLAPGEGEGDLDAHAGPRADRLGEVLDAALAACADAAHRGLRHLTPTARARLDRAAADLDRTGFRSAAALLTDLGHALGAGDPQRMIDAWVAAQLRLLTTAELR